MAVEALQLRPRGAVALFDAAIRVCATSSGVWALTLPGGAALVAALLALAEAVRHGRPLVGPAGLLTAAWVLRAIGQGAACHHLEQQLLGSGPPTVSASLRAALRRAPGLVTGSLVMGALDLALWTFTLGLGFGFLGAHAAGYATLMRGEGSALRVYGTASRLLGPARRTAPWVRVCGLTQVLLAVNLQLLVMLGLYLARSLLGFEVAFLQRLTAVDDPVWVAIVAATTFALFEPLRAATGTLLLVDGRVRLEGLDLLAQVRQLPRRRRPGGGALLALAALLALPALAQQSLAGRLEAVQAQCGMEAHPLGRVTSLGARDQAALSRFVSRVERLAHDDDDCEGAEDALAAGLALMATGEAPPGTDPAALAREVLARPEFLAAPAPADEPAAEGWWDALWRRFRAWLKGLEPRDRTPEPRVPGADPMAGANVVMALAVAGVVALLVVLLVRAWRDRLAAPVATEALGVGVETPLGREAGNALSRPPEGWAGLADELAARGDFRGAIRHLYLALLARLHRQGAIRYEPTRSNWEYLRGFQGPGPDRLAFRELTRRFDFAWYGRQEAGAAAWERFRHLARPLLGPAEAADA